MIGVYYDIGTIYNNTNPTNIIQVKYSPDNKCGILYNPATNIFFLTKCPCTVKGITKMLDKRVLKGNYTWTSMFMATSSIDMRIEGINVEAMLRIRLDRIKCEIKGYCK